MQDLLEAITDVVKASLPSEMGMELLSAVEAAGILRATLQMSSYSKLVYEAVSLSELKYAYLLGEEKYNLYDVLTNASCRQLHERLSIAIKFLEDKMSRHNLIPATDLLRISEFLRTGKQFYLQDTDLLDIHPALINEMNDVLTVTYNTCFEQHCFIKIAVICCGLGANQNVDPLALYALCSVLINQKDRPFKLPLSICRYLLLEKPFVGQPHSSDAKQCMIAFIRNLRYVFISQARLVYDMKPEIEDICEKIKRSIPKNSAHVIESVLMSKLSFFGSEIQDSAHISYRTAFGYIGKLRNSGVVDSVKVGKENLYINIPMLSKIERGLADGTEKS